MKETIKKFLMPTLVWYLLFGIDVYLCKQMQAPTSVKELAFQVGQPLLYAVPLGGLTVLLGRFRWLLVPVFTYLFAIESIEFFLFRTFRTPFTGDLLLIVLNSSKSEILSVAGAFLSVRSVGVALGVVLLGVALGWIAFRDRRPVCAVRPWALLLLCLPLVLRLSVTAAMGRKILLPLAADVIVDTVASYEASVEYWNACRNPAPFGDVSICRRDGAAPIGVIVIGESATRNNLQLYGYGRETTPRLCALADELFVFDDLVASWSHTLESLHHLLTEKDLTDGKETLCTFPQVCGRAGYRCLLLSNQDHWGRYDTLNAALFSSCDEATWLGDLKSERKLYDLDMVGMLEAAVRRAGEAPVLSFVHLYGCHFPYAGYPESFRKFPTGLTDACNRHLDADGRAMYNGYDNAILQSDAVVGDIIELVRQQHRPAFVVFVSDHGETPRADDMRVETDRDLWEIPLVIWLSEEYRRDYPETVARVRASLSKRLQADQLFVGLLSLAQIGGYARYAAERDFLAPEFRPRERRLVQMGKVVYEKDR